MQDNKIIDYGNSDDQDFPDAFYEKSVKILSEYISIKTVNPPGNEKPGVEFLQYILDQNELASKIYETAPGRFGLVAKIPGSDPDLKPVVIANHIDVVPADESEWDVAPFSGMVKDGYIWGRGALDMKGMGIMELMALLAIHKRQDQIKRGLVFLALPDEERAGKHGARVFAENHLDEINPAVVINEGGFGVKGMLFDGIVFAIDVTEKLQMKLKLTATETSRPGIRQSHVSLWLWRKLKPINSPFVYIRWSGNPSGDLRRRKNFPNRYFSNTVEGSRSALF